jgi:hypothetical protein
LNYWTVEPDVWGLAVIAEGGFDHPRPIQGPCLVIEHDSTVTFEARTLTFHACTLTVQGGYPDMARLIIHRLRRFSQITGPAFLICEICAICGSNAFALIQPRY